MKNKRGKEINRTNISPIISPRHFTHTKWHHHFSPLLPKIPVCTRSRSFSAQLLPVESPLVGFLNNQKWDFLQLDRASAASLFISLQLQIPCNILYNKFHEIFDWLCSLIPLSNTDITQNAWGHSPNVWRHFPEYLPTFL